ncbi:MAG: SDR family oxidoreductase [Candidatus Eremiobacteraeota bacterium]|nr:SDR family oxidoreductase [Candidatus Eremiobacteraeota bacterium]
MSDPQRPARAALVTGAARGLARGIAASLAGAGYRVAFTFRPGGTPPDETLAAIRACGGDPLAIAADHEIEGRTADAVREVEGALGRIDVLVHAVGPMILRRFERSTLDDYRAMLDGNFRSAVEAAHAVLPGMRERRFGRLIFFGMNGSQATRPARGMSLYAASKAAVVSFARTLAVEEARYGITVNAVEPGDIREKDLDRERALHVAANNPTGHAGSWEDVAYAVRFLAADEAGFINGEVLSVNGGLAEAHE